MPAQEPMRYDPVTGDDEPYPRLASEHRFKYWLAIWHFNPWTGSPRAIRDVEADPLGLGLQPKIQFRNHQ